MLRSEFAYELPPELIARYPTPRRGDSRLLHLRGATGTVRDLEFSQLPQLLHEGDLLVFNDTRVVPARVFGHKDSGGRVEILLERLLDARLALVQLRASKPPRPAAELTLDGGVKVRVAGRRDEFWELAFDEDAGPVFERAGEMPLPPYLGRAAEPMDRERYQTVYARRNAGICS